MLHKCHQGEVTIKEILSFFSQNVFCNSGTVGQAVEKVNFLQDVSFKHTKN